jgi:hypothetical protein
VNSAKAKRRNQLWIKVLDSGQEIDMEQAAARRFVANGHAVTIPAPKVSKIKIDPSLSSERKAIERIEDPLAKEAAQLAYAYQLPMTATALVLRVLKLEQQLAERAAVAK